MKFIRSRKLLAGVTSMCLLSVAIGLSSCGNGNGIPSSAISLLSSAPAYARMEPVDNQAKQFPLALYLENGDQNMYMVPVADGWKYGWFSIAVVNDSDSPYHGSGNLLVKRGVLETKEGKQYTTERFAWLLQGNRTQPSFMGDPSKDAIPIEMFYWPRVTEQLDVIPPHLVAQRFWALTRWAESATLTRYVLETSLGTWAVNIPSSAPVYVPSPDKVKAEDQASIVKVESDKSSPIQVNLDTQCLPRSENSFLNVYHLKYTATNTDKLDNASTTISLSFPSPMWLYYGDAYIPQPTVIRVTHTRGDDHTEISLGPGQSKSGYLGFQFNPPSDSGSFYETYYYDYPATYALTKEGETYKFYNVPPRCLF